MSLPEQIVKYRAKERLSQAKLAALCGVSLQTLNSIETGQQTPSRVTEAKIRLVIDDSKEEK